MPQRKYIEGAVALAVLFLTANVLPGWIGALIFGEAGDRPTEFWEIVQLAGPRALVLLGWLWILYKLFTDEWAPVREYLGLMMMGLFTLLLTWSNNRSQQTYVIVQPVQRDTSGDLVVLLFIVIIILGAYTG